MIRPRALAVSALAGVALVAAGALVYRAGAVFAADPVSATPPDLAEGARLYAETCASCHGADLEGQPDWRAPGPDGLYPAPPHDQTGHTWHHSDRVLFDYTRKGGAALLAEQGVAFDSGMPGFSDELSDDEILSVLAYIKSTWPERMRAVQAERSRLDNTTD